MNGGGIRCTDSDLVRSFRGPGRGVSAVQAWAHQNIVPLNVTIETTLVCNIRCLHCYNCDRDTAGAAGNPPGEPLRDDEILNAMTDVRAAGCLFLSLTGGEVLTHPGLFRFLDHARKLSLAVQLLTNGTMLRPGIAGRLATYPNLLGVSISLYGATADVHDGITQVAGSFARTWAGARRLKSLGIAVRLKFLIMRQNSHEVALMRQAADEGGFPYSADVQVTARHDGTAGSLATRVSREQLEAAYRGPLRDLLPTGPRTITAETAACNCARGNCAITSTGDVLPCISVPLPAGNIRRQPFAEIWRSSPVFQRIRNLKLADYPQCAPCGHKGYCSRNRGAAYTASGEYTGVDPFICEGAEILHRIADKEHAEAPVPGRDLAKGLPMWDNAL